MEKRGRDQASGPRDGGAMVVIALILIAVAALVALGTIQEADPGEQTVVEAHRQPLADLFFSMRSEVLQEVHRLPPDGRNVSWEDHVSSLPAPLVSTARQLGITLEATILAEKSDGPDRLEEANHTDPTGTRYADLWTLSGTRIAGELYDGASDGLLHDADGQDVLGVLVYISAYSDAGEMTEMLVVEPKGRS